MTNRERWWKYHSVLRGTLRSVEESPLRLAQVGPTRGGSRYGARLPLLLAAAVSMALTGCALTGPKASSASSGTPLVSVSVTQAPPATLLVGSFVTVSATVSNDLANAGVDWVAMCGSAPQCGSFSPSHTASGASTVYTAPPGVPVGHTVAVTAQSTTDRSKSAAVTVLVSSTVTGVTITQAPPSTYPSGGSFGVAATVAGDPANEGVDWTANCGGVNCTSGFNGLTHSLPGVPTTFVVPLALVNLQTIVGSTVTLTAFATADHSFSASASFVVTAPIAISITQPPPSTLLTNASASVIAVVTNDPANAGVDWEIASCDLSPCGSWSATNSMLLTTHTASGAPAAYFAPSTAVNHVIIQAVATASPANTVAKVEISIVAPVAIEFTVPQPVTNGMIVANATAPLTAVVTNDPANKGVDWTVTCASTGACGTFTPAHTDSGSPVSYQAPSAVPTGGSVTITAASTADPTKTVSQTVTVTAKAAPDSLLQNGRWIMLLSGQDANGGGPFVLGGAMDSDGIGNITSAEFDLVDNLGTSNSAFYNSGTVSLSQTTPSSYSIGPDGRGQIHLIVDVSNLGQGSATYGVNQTGAIALSVVFVNANHALLSENDSFGSGGGTLDLQSSGDLKAFRNETAGPNGVYSLALTGLDVTTKPNGPYDVAAAVGLHSSGASYTETSYISDQSDKGVNTNISFQTVSHTFTNPVPDINGKMGLVAVNLGLPRTFSLDAWLIDANHFVITDVSDVFASSGTPPPPQILVSGYLVAQPASATVSGTYAFTENGHTVSPGFHPQAAGGIITCASTGTLDFSALGGTPPPLSNHPITVLCANPVTGRGKISLLSTGGSGITRFSAYPTLDQGLFLMELDGGAAGTSGPSGSGVARPVTLTAPIAPTSFSGKYAANFLLNTPVGLQAFAGQIVPDGVSMISGTADVNSFNASAPPLGTPSSNATLSGSFTAGPNGRFPLALKITPAAGQPAPEFTNLNPVCYVLDASTCLLLELDTPAAPGTGILELQNTGL